MDTLWKVAVGAAGIGGVAAFFLWATYKQWLSLGIFQKLTKQQQFILFLVLLISSLLFAIAGLATYVAITSLQSGNPILKWNQGELQMETH